MAVIMNRWSQEYISRKSIQLVASYPGHSKFLMLHAKKTEGLLEFHDVMDVVQDDVLE